jgi:hypothetical protein
MSIDPTDIIGIFFENLLHGEMETFAERTFGIGKFHKGYFCIGRTAYVVGLRYGCKGNFRSGFRRRPLFGWKLRLKRCRFLFNLCRSFKNGEFPGSKSNNNADEKEC